MPGWAWLVLGILIALGAVLLAPKFMKSEGGDGFFRPRPNPDAQPVAEAAGGADDEALVPEDLDATAAARKDDAVDPAAAPKERDYDFYTLLPGEEVALSDAQLAAAAREEAARKARSAQPTAAARPEPASDTQAGVRPQPLPEDGAPAAAPAPPAPPEATVQAATGPVPIAKTVPPTANTPYILQAGAFGAAGDAEEVKAKIALLGLNARVESAEIGGKTVYRVRMGPYGTAAELSTAKAKLSGGGLPALAIKAK